MAAGAEQDRSTPLSRHPIAMGPGDPLDQAVQAKAPQVVRHPARSHVVGRLPQQGGPIIPQVAVGVTSFELILLVRLNVGNFRQGSPELLVRKVMLRRSTLSKNNWRR